MTTPAGTGATSPVDHYDYAFAVPMLSSWALLLFAGGLALAALRRRMRS